MIPQNYEQWRHCITVSCKIPMTRDYVSERLVVWANPDHEESLRFRKLDGQRHYQNVLAWFRQANLELGTSL
jgi:hypothetical protein